MSKILADLSLRLTAENAELSKKLAESNAKINSFGKNTQDVGKQIQGAWLKLGAAVAGGAAILKTAERAINSTQGTADAYERTMAGLNSTVDSFFIAISSGDWTNFFDSALKAKRSAEDLADVLDYLGDIRRSHSIKAVELEGKQDELMVKMMDKTGTYTLNQRKEYYKEYERITTEFNKQISDAATLEKDAILKNYADITGLAPIDIQAIISNYGDYSDRFSKAKDDLKAAKDNWGQLHDAAKEGLFSQKNYLKGLSEVDRFFTLLTLNFEKLNDAKLDKATESIIAEGAALNSNVKTQRELLRVKNSIYKQDKQAQEIDYSRNAIFEEPEMDIEDWMTKAMGKKQFEIPVVFKPVPFDISKPLEGLDEIKKSAFDAGQAITDTIGASVANLTSAFGTLFSETGSGFKDVVTAALASGQQIINILLAEAIAGILAKEATTKGLFGLITGSIGIGVLLSLWKSKVPEFEDGGFVPGNSFTGDKVPAWVNSGELILNRAQQQSLFSGNNMSGGNVVFRIQGRELVGILQKENTKINSF